MPRGFGRNVPRATTPAGTSARVGGSEVTVAGDAVAGFAARAADPEAGVNPGVRINLSVRALRDSIGADGIRAAAAAAGRRPPSDRTIRRWVAADRIPHDAVGERAQRRAMVERHGGVKGLAARLGVSPSTISRYQNGQTTQFKDPRTRRRQQALATGDALNRAGIADAQGNVVRSPKISVDAAFQYRNAGKSSSDYRSSRAFDVDLSTEDAQLFADAVAQGDHAAAVAAIERHLTLDYATTFTDFDDDTGFHIQEIRDFTVDWGLD